MFYTILGLLPFLCSNSQIAFNGSTTKSGTGVSSLTFSKTVTSGSNTLLYVGVTTQNKNITRVKWGTLTLTQFTIGTRNSMRVAMYYLALGNRASSTTSNVVVTLAGSNDVFAGAADYSGVWQAAPIVNPAISQAKSNRPLVTFASSAGNLAISLLGAIAASPSSNGVGQTQYWSFAGSHANRSTSKAGAASVTMSHTISASEDWVMIGGTLQDHAVVLPIELISLEAKCHPDHNELTWITASEKNSAFFRLERSEDAQNWFSVAVITAKGNCSSETRYDFSDNDKGLNTAYYRLIQYDSDGSFTRSNIVHSDCEADLDDKIIMFPNPAKAVLNFSFEFSHAQGPCKLIMINNLGEIVLEEKFLLDQNRTLKQVDVSLPESSYQLFIVNNNGRRLFQKKVIIQ